MRIARSGRFVFVAQWVMIVLLPLVFFLGRGLVGAGVGWLAVLGVVYGIVVIIVLAVPPVFTASAMMIGLAYLATVVFGIIGIARWRRPFDA